MSTRDVESVDLESVDTRRSRDDLDDVSGEEDGNNAQRPSESDILYDIDTAPPWHLAMVLGFQVSQQLVHHKAVWHKSFRKHITSPSPPQII